jgi:hypothetical protein
MHITRKQLLIGIPSIVILLAAGLVAFLMYDYSVGFGAPSHPSFTGYKPKVLPTGTKVTGQQLTRSKEAGLDFWNFSYAPQFNSSDIHLYEREKSKYSVAPLNCEHYGGYCRTFTTPSGHSYRVVSSLYQGKRGSPIVEWIQGNTSFYLAVSEQAKTKYTDYDWAPMIDSMQPVDLSNMPYKKVTHKMGGA